MIKDVEQNTVKELKNNEKKYQIRNKEIFLQILQYNKAVKCTRKTAILMVEMKNKK